MMKDNISLQLFKEWTDQLKDRMHAELAVLCDRNVSLEVEN